MSNEFLVKKTRSARKGLIFNSINLIMYTFFWSFVNLVLLLLCGRGEILNFDFNPLHAGDACMRRSKFTACSALS